MPGINGRDERARMEEAAKHGMNETDYGDKLLKETSDADYAKKYKLRGRLYDKFNFSLRAIDTIIIVTCVLIVAAIVVGILIGQ